MKRDLDLIRKLLFFFEEKESLQHVEVPPIDGYDEPTIRYHLVLLHDARLLRCEPVKSSTSDRVIYVLPFELTWEGHEFLDTIRSDTAWARTKKAFLDRGVDMSFDLVKTYAKDAAAALMKVAFGS